MAAIDIKKATQEQCSRVVARKKKNWDVSNVTTMERMFESSIAFNQPIDKWDVSNVTDMQAMFIMSKAFNQPIDKWDVSKVKKMKGLFFQSAFNQH